MAPISKISNLLFFITVCVSVQVFAKTQGLSAGDYSFESVFLTKKDCKKTFLNNACSITSNAVSATPTPLTIELNKKKNKVAIQGSCGKYLEGTCGGIPAFTSKKPVYVWDANEVKGKENTYRIQLANAKCDESFLKAASSSSKPCGSASLILAAEGDGGLMFEVVKSKAAPGPKPKGSCSTTQYLKDGKCTKCATSCPAGEYIKTACTATADIVCAACTYQTTDRPGCPSPMVLKFDTTKGFAGGDNDVTVPLLGSVTVVIDWGDGSTPEKVTAAGLKTHTYAKSGIYIVQINGSLSGFGAASDAFDPYRTKLVEVISFGQIGTTTFSYAFYRAENLAKVPNILPPGVTNLEGMFEMTDIFNADISGWDVSSVTNMKRMFMSCKAFNKDISDWDVSSVTNMSKMFLGNGVFNQPLNAWGDKTAKVTDMSEMFKFAMIFNQDISGWDVSSVTTMSSMFYSAEAFNQPIGNGGWDVSSVTDMNYMFDFAKAFNKDITGWSQDALTTCTDFKKNQSVLQCSNVPSAEPLKTCAACNG